MFAVAYGLQIVCAFSNPNLKPTTNPRVEAWRTTNLRVEAWQATKSRVEAGLLYTNWARVKLCSKPQPYHPLSVVLLDLLVNVWAKTIKQEVPSARPTGYADDTGVTSLEAEAVQATLNITEEFARLTGQVLNANKSKCWVTSTNDRTMLEGMHLDGELVPRTAGDRLLGAFVSFQRGVCNVLSSARVKRGVQISERIRWAPLPLHARARLLASLVLPSSLYGCSVSSIAHTQLNSLTSAVMRAVWGTTRKLRSKDVVLTLFVAGHLVDPRQAIVYQCLCTLRSFV